MDEQKSSLTRCFLARTLRLGEKVLHRLLMRRLHRPYLKDLHPFSLESGCLGILIILQEFRFIDQHQDDLSKLLHLFLEGADAGVKFVYTDRNVPYVHRYMIADSRQIGKRDVFLRPPEE